MIRKLIPLLTATCVALAAGCSSDEDASEGEESALASTELGRLGPKHFRNTFAHYLRAEGKDDEAIRSLVYLAPKEVTDPDVDIDPSQPLAAIDARFRGFRPSALFEHGKRTPMNDRADVESPLAQRPVHIVVIPGIFGEFIDVAPFEEVLAGPSSARTAWEKVVAEKGQTPEAMDSALDPKTVKEEPRPLGSLLRVGSIDGEDGKPRVTITYLAPPLGSLETLGTLEEDSALYERRLARYFALVGAPENLYVMGYSRGATVALDLIARASAKPAKNPWLPKLRGMISLAGVLYGSQIADAARAKGTPAGDVIEVVEQLGKDLQPCTADMALSSRLAVQATNTANWVAATAKATYRATKLPRHVQIEWEGISSEAPDYARLTTFARKLLVDDVFTLTSPIDDYCPNVARFKLAAKKAVDGIDSLTTESRLTWWRTHTLPKNIRYFALTGTMGDATRQPGQTWPGVTNEAAYDPGSIDFKSLRTNYYDLLQASGIEANDSQVTLSRAKFWPSLTPLLNPKQGELRTYFMGTLGTHHWGLAFPRAFATNDGRTANPFPRKTLLHAIGAFVSYVDVHEGKLGMP